MKKKEKKLFIIYYYYFVFGFKSVYYVFELECNILK